MSKATLQCNALYLVPTRHKAPSSDNELNYFAGAALAGQPDRLYLCTRMIFRYAVYPYSQY